MKKISALSSMVVIFLLAVVPQVPARDKTFSGRVIDAETKEPIEGAVVVAYWKSERPSILGEDTRLEDVKETLTDKNGNWSIAGKKGRSSPPVPFFIFIIATVRYTREPQFIVFKPGYCSWPKGFFIIDACKGKMKPEGNDEIAEGKTLELPKLTNRADRLAAQMISPLYPSSDDPKIFKKFIKKQSEFFRLLDEERRNLGLSEYRYYKELKDEE